MIDELRIVIARNMSRDGMKRYPFVAHIEGYVSRGYGYSVKAALRDLFSAGPPHDVVTAFEKAPITEHEAQPR